MKYALLDLRAFFFFIFKVVRFGRTVLAFPWFRILKSVEYINIKKNICHIYHLFFSFYIYLTSIWTRSIWYEHICEHFVGCNIFNPFVAMILYVADFSIMRLILFFFNSRKFHFVYISSYDLVYSILNTSFSIKTKCWRYRFKKSIYFARKDARRTFEVQEAISCHSVNVNKKMKKNFSAGSGLISAYKRFSIPAMKMK